MSEQLGKYTLSRRIACGGMAEVFLAQDDKGRSCVIKRMLPNLLVDPQFSRMFLDEAKLVVQLNHPAIAQISDFGQDKGVLYLAMEWVDGTNLRTIVKDFAKRAGKIPYEHCARLVAEVGQALGYAHRAIGIDGKPLKIIHRDVSPQNILLGQTGKVKLIDFGVAKAASSTQVTAAGMIKGKFAYMSPEQLRGDPLDGRSDIFGLGLVLYELLAAQRAIPGSTEAEIAQNALQMKFAPIEQRRPDIPPALKAVLARALQKSRDARYGTAEEMSAELEAFIQAHNPGLSGQDLAALIPEAEEEVTATPAGRGSGSKPAAPAAPAAAPNPVLNAVTRDMPRPPKYVPPPVEAASGVGPTDPFWQGPTIDAVEVTIDPPGAVAPGSPFPITRDPQRPSTLPQYPSVAARPHRSKGPLIAVLALAALAGGVGLFFFAPRPEAPAVEVVPPAPVPAVAAAVQPPAPPEPAPAPEPPPPAAAPAAPSKTTGRLVLSASIPARVSVDGKEVGKTPFDVNLPPGVHQVMFIELDGDTRQSRKVELKAGETRTEDWKPEKGRVVVRAVPWAEVFVGGKSLGITPIDPISMYSGRHTMTFVNGDTNRRDERTIEVKPGADTMVKVDLRSLQKDPKVE